MNVKKLWPLITPSTWPAWLAMACLWLITRLPIAWQLSIGRLIGKIVYVCSPKLRRIAEINIALCFPELSLQQRTDLVKKNFISLGIGLIETAMAWWLSDKRLQKCSIRLIGAEYADAAFAKGHGIILLGPHFTCLEMVGRLFGSRYSFAVMYRPHKKPMISYIQERFRKKYNIKQIARHRMRELISTLKENMAVWYAYDVDGGEKRSVFAPFFGVQTATLTAVSRLATLSGTSIVPISFYRLDDCWGYEIKLSPALENFPGDNLPADATQLNEHLEKAIRDKPEQYIWQYKRFKTRPPGEKRFY
jgi:KDO2-lipid IV(A) lauroyltransferase